MCVERGSVCGEGQCVWRGAVCVERGSVCREGQCVWRGQCV